MASRLVYQSRFELANRFTNHEGNTRADAIPVSSFFRTMPYSLRRALSLDSVDGCTHNQRASPRQKLPAVLSAVRPARDYQ